MTSVSPRAFAALSRRSQIARLRSLGRRALSRYGIENAQLALRRHEHNTTFRVDARDCTYLLRINRPGVYAPAAIESEMAWLRALRDDTDLGVPEPVAARDGALVVVASDPAVAEQRACVLLRWLDGRFVERRLVPKHMRRVGALAARLQEHATSWVPPSGFVRPRVDTLTSAAKARTLAPSAATAARGEHPARDDADRALELVEMLASPEDAVVCSEALAVVWSATRALAREGSASGLLHADLHYENVLFHGHEARAIDFDDCGWGFCLYDLAVILSELEDRSRYDELRYALLDTYAQQRPLPRNYEGHLGALSLLRRLQILLWILESREHAAFRERWQVWVREELDAIAAAI